MLPVQRRFSPPSPARVEPQSSKAPAPKALPAAKPAANGDGRAVSREIVLAEPAGPPGSLPPPHVSPFQRQEAAGGDQEFPDPELAEPSVLADAISRYHYYCDFGISDEHIAPPEQIWAEHALSLVPPAPPRGVSDEYYDILIENSMREMEREYYSSVKRSIVDYVLYNRTERIRLNLELLGGLIKSPKTQRLAMRDLPDVWRDNVENAREEVAWTLQTLSPHALELQALWEAGFAIRLLCDVSSASFRKGLPFEPEAFRAFQNEVAEAAKGALWTSWVPRTAELFRRSPPVCINNDSEAYYRSIAYLQSNQLRTLVRVRPHAHRAHRTLPSRASSCARRAPLRPC